MTRMIRCGLTFVLASMLTSQVSLAAATGELRLHPFRSEIFGNERMLRVWLPPGFAGDAKAHRPYPVLYLNDGQNLFDEKTSTFSDDEWKVDETVTQLIEEGAIPPVIVVGVDHPGRKMRPNEFLPWEDIHLQPPTTDPQGKLYPSFLLEEVIPFIEASYPVQAAPSGRLLGGSSYGALISLYTVLARPGEFGKLLIESPSLYVDDLRILKKAAGARVWPERSYLGVGTHEGRSSCREEGNSEPVEHVRLLEKIIQENSPETHLKVVVDPCGLHNEEAYARRLPAALRFLLAN